MAVRLTVNTWGSIKKYWRFESLDDKQKGRVNRYGCMFGGSYNSIVSPAPLPQSVSQTFVTHPNSDTEQPPDYNPFDELIADLEATNIDPHTDEDFFSPRGFDSP